MSQLILDDQLDEITLLEPLKRWITVQRLGRIRPGEVIKDERIPMLLRELKQPTFLTIDNGFWNKNLRDTRYCIIYFALQDNEQWIIPNLLRGLFRQPEFRTKAARMGKVARVSTIQVEYWQFGEEQLHKLVWNKS